MSTTPLLRRLFPSLLWKKTVSEKVLYLTFDDGPIPEVTPWVLDQLRHYKAKATFFCIGDNVRKYPKVYHSILDAGHRVGNHTFHHLNGWQTNNYRYFKDVVHCAELVSSNLFRPPFGRIKPSQVYRLKKNYRIVMWDVLSKDYDIQLSGEDCFRKVRNEVSPGSIVVFHDSLKAETRLRYALPATLDYFSKQGYRFASLEETV